MQDRLAELRRQRALVAEHLAWLDRELAAAAPAEAASPSSENKPRPASDLAAPPPGLPAGPLAPADNPPPDSTPHAALPEAKPAEIRSDVRRGCFLYFAIATLLGLAGVALIIWLSQAYKKSHPPKPRIEQTERP
ncbi:MAG: hypothetical protein QM691_01855 [Opitutaceae bacterium]